jgi:hypothetical protein
MSDSVQLTYVHEGERSVWLYRLDDGSLRVSEIDPYMTASADERLAGFGLTIPSASVDRLAFALLIEKYRGRSEVLQHLRRFLSSESIDHVIDPAS